MFYTPEATAKNAESRIRESSSSHRLSSLSSFSSFSTSQFHLQQKNLLCLDFCVRTSQMMICHKSPWCAPTLTTFVNKKRKERESTENNKPSVHATKFSYLKTQKNSDLN